MILRSNDQDIRFFSAEVATFFKSVDAALLAQALLEGDRETSYSHIKEQLFFCKDRQLNKAIATLKHRKILREKEKDKLSYIVDIPKLRLLLNEGRRQSALPIRHSQSEWREAPASADGRRNNCRGIQTHQQLKTAAAWRLPTLPLAKAMRSTRMEIMAGALDPKVRRKKEKSNLLPSALKLLPSKAEALVDEIQGGEVNE